MIKQLGSLSHSIAALRRARVVVGALALALLASGCQGVYDLPLPGGAATGDDAYRVSVEFVDVLDLVPQSAVKVNDVTVGAVEEIELDGWTAVVSIRLSGDVSLPDNAFAELRQTSLLGEKFVSLSAPEEAVGELSDGDRIPLGRSGRNPEVEEVLGALSLLLNGGGIAQLQVINRELGDALEGRESDVRGVIEQLDVFVGGLEESKSEIVRAIDAIDALSGTLAEQKQDLAVALEEIPGGLEVLADQREQLTQMLTALSDLGVVATRVTNASRADTVANLEALQPILTQLNEAGEALPASLELLFTYPFSDGSIDAVTGDYSNLIVTLDANYESLCLDLGIPDCELPEGPALPELPPLPELPELPPLPELPVDPCALLEDGSLPVTCPPLELCEQIEDLPECSLETICPILEAQDLPGGLPDACEGIPTEPTPELCTAFPGLPGCPAPPGDPESPLPDPTLPEIPGLPGGGLPGGGLPGGGGLLGSGQAGFDQAGYSGGLAMLLLGGVRA